MAGTTAGRSAEDGRTKFPLMNATVVAAIVAGGLTLIGTIAAQILGRNATNRATQAALERQTSELNEQLRHQRVLLLNERFATAVGQLGSESSAVRLAGVYALTTLADDWVENRQTYVDVLCGYLRIPTDYPSDATPERVQRAYAADREVRDTIIRVLTAHLQDDAVVYWKGLNFDFTGVIFDTGDFSGANFSGGQVSFRLAKFPTGGVEFGHAKFSGGTVDFAGAEFSGGTVDFAGAAFSGAKVSFTDAAFSGGRVDFTDAAFRGGEVSFLRAAFSGGRVDFDHAAFTGGEVSFRIANFSGSKVSFALATFSDGEVSFGAGFSGGEVSFAGAFFSGSKVLFIGAGFSGGEVRFAHAVFSGGWLDFAGAKFSGARVDFTGEFPGEFGSFRPAIIRDGVDISGEPPGPISPRPKFSGGKVDFSNAQDWSVPPLFPWTDTPPPGVKLPKKEDQSRA